MLRHRNDTGKILGIKCVELIEPMSDPFSNFDCERFVRGLFYLFCGQGGGSVVGRVAVRSPKQPLSPLAIITRCFVRRCVSGCLANTGAQWGTTSNASLLRSGDFAQTCCANRFAVWIDDRDTTKRTIAGENQIRQESIISKFFGQGRNDLTPMSERPLCYFFVATGFLRFGKSSLQMPQTVPWHPLAVQCSRP